MKGKRRGDKSASAFSRKNVQWPCLHHGGKKLFRRLDFIFGLYIKKGVKYFFAFCKNFL